jgi:exodeoxyribonuclease-5
MEYTKCQENAITEFQKWLNQDKQFFLLEGLAGSGKSYITKTFIEMLKEKNLTLACLAFTGAAANVLQKSTGVVSTTIHKFIYKFEMSKDFFHNEEEEKEELANSKELQIKKAKCFIVDECSLISEEILLDLLKTDKKLIFVGDFKQLPPIKPFTKEMFINKLGEDCYTSNMTTVVRQMQDHPILGLANALRNSVTNLVCFDKTSDYGSVSIKKQVKLQLKEWSNENHQIIVFKNTTRQDINKRVRDKLKYVNILEPNEKIIVCKNNYSHKVFNGEQFRIVSVGDEQLECGLLYREIIVEYLDGSGIMKKLDVLMNNLIDPDFVFEVDQELKQWMKVKMWNMYKNLVHIDYAYAITCHKAQGGEWENVFVLASDYHGKDYSRWLYTATTRAKKNLIIKIK